MSDPIENTAQKSKVSAGSEKLESFLDRESLACSAYPGAERTEYDFTGERLSMHSTRLPETILKLTMSCLGAGILVMHVGVMYGGMYTSLVATAVLVPILAHCMMMLVSSAQKKYVELRIPALSYAGLAEVAAATGPSTCMRIHAKTFRYMVDMSLFIDLTGIVCVYLIVIAVTLKKAIETLSSSAAELNLSERIYILIATVPLMAISLIRGLKVLAPVSIVAIMFIGICLSSTIFLGLSEGHSGYSMWNGPQGLFRYLGICLFSINGVGVTLSVENYMNKPKLFYVVLEYSMTLVVLCVCAVGFIGYWSWGDNCKGPFTIQMPFNLYTAILQLGLALMFCVIFAVHLFAPFRIAWHYAGKKHKRKRCACAWERFYRLVHVLLVMCVCVAFPNMAKLIIFFGNFFAAHIAFIYPPIIESLVTWTEPRKGRMRWKLVKHTLLIMFGVSLNVAAVYAVMDI